MIETKSKRIITVPEGMLSTCLKNAERYVKYHLGLGGISIFYEIRGKTPYDRITLSVLPLTQENRRRMEEDKRYLKLVECISDKLNIPLIIFVVHIEYIYFALRKPRKRGYSIHRTTRQQFWDLFYKEDFERAKRVKGKLPHETENSEDWYSVHHHGLPRNFYSIDIDSMQIHPENPLKPLCIEMKRYGENLTYNQKVGFGILQKKVGAEFHILYLKEKK